MTKSSRTLWPPSRFRGKNVLPYIPTGRLSFLFLLTAALAVPAWYMGWKWTACLIVNVALIAVSLADLAMLPRRQSFTCRRVLPQKTERGQELTVKIILSCSSDATLSFRFIDDLPPGFENPFPVSGRETIAGSLSLSYQTKALIRGDHVLDQVYFRYRSPLGLWEKQIVFAVHDKISVIPDMSSVRGTLASLPKMLLEQGRKIKKNSLGSGEFTQVRSYVVGDDPRKINWRQSAKLTELMSNVYEPEHGKIITVLIDCSRIMGVQLAHGSRLEKALEAALTVAAVALRQGDYVSILAFSNEVKTYIAPGKGTAHFHLILDGLYNLQYDPFDPNYAAAFYHLQSVQKRQSFVLIFSDLDPFLNAGPPLTYLQRVRQTHPLLILGIADPLIAQWLETKPADSRQGLILSMAQKEILRKKKEVGRLGRLGIPIIEAAEETLASEAVSQYIEVINRNVL